MLDKLEAIKAKFTDLGVALSNPEIVNNNQRFGAMSKEYRSLEKIVKAYEEYKRLLSDIDFNKEALNGDDEELRELAKAEVSGLEERKEQMEASIRQMLIPKDPQDEKNAILEIRAGTGGDEASLFAGDLLRMYIKYCEKRGWKTAVLSEGEGTVGGYKEIQVEVVGVDVPWFDCGTPASYLQAHQWLTGDSVCVWPGAESRLRPWMTDAIVTPRYTVLVR